MSANTCFYTPQLLNFADAVQIVESVLDVKTAADHNIHSDFQSGWIYFDYKGEDRSLFWMDKTTLFDENLPHTYFKLGAYGSAVEIMTKLGKRLGGWLDENDCDDEPNIYIEPAESLMAIEPTNYQHLVRLLAEKIPYNEAQKSIKFIQENKDLILRYDFGQDA